MVEMVIHHLHGYQHPNPCHSHQPVAIWGSWLLIFLYLLQITWKRNKTNTLWANVTTRLSKTFTLLNSSNSSSDQFTPFSTLPLLAPHLFPFLTLTFGQPLLRVVHIWGKELGSLVKNFEVILTASELSHILPKCPELRYHRTDEIHQRHFCLSSLLAQGRSKLDKKKKSPWGKYISREH